MQLKYTDAHRTHVYDVANPNFCADVKELDAPFLIDYKTAFEAGNVEEVVTTAERAQMNSEEAKKTRDEAIEAPIASAGFIFDIDAKARDNIRNSIEFAKRNPLAPQEAQWILADNSILTVTVADLEAVMDAYSIRMQQIFDSYTLWRVGDKQQPFTL